MVKFYSPLSFVFLLVVFSSCKQDIDTYRDDRNKISIDESIAEKGHIRVKINPEIEAKIASAANSEDAVQAFDRELAALLGASRMERTFPHGGKFETRMRQAGLHLWYEVYFDEEEPVTRAMTIFLDSPYIQTVEPSYVLIQHNEGKVVEASTQAVQFGASAYGTMPFNDALLSKQWHYENDGTLGDGFKGGADINLFKAWAVETGKPQVIVAVLDGGVDFTHEDLSVNMWVNKVELSGTSDVDDDGNGYKDDIHGWNFYDNSATLTYSDHGTHVAGTVAAVNNNGIGVAGVAGGDGTSNSGVRIMSCQISSPDGEYVTGLGINRAFVYAANNGAVIAQCSWGYPSGASLPESDKSAIDYFIDYAGLDENGHQTGPLKGGLVIAASGNSHVGTPIYPAALPRVLAIAAMGPDYKIPFYSNYGTYIGLVAPGGTSTLNNSTLIWSTLTSNRYGGMSGTSMACPHVSGIAALVISKYGVGHSGFTWEVMMDILKRATHDIYTENPTYNFLGEKRLGTGYIDAWKALMEAAPPEAVKDLTVKWGATSAKTDWTVPHSDSGQKPERFIILYSTSELDIDPDVIPDNIPRIVVEAASVDMGGAMSAEITGLTAFTTYHIAIISEYAWVRRSEISTVTGKTYAAGIQLYPNPMRQVLNVRVDKDMPSLDFSIYNAAGARVYSTSLSSVSVYAPVALDVSKLSGGTYTAVVKIGGKEHRYNLIKQ